MEETWGASTIVNIVNSFCMQVTMLTGSTLCGVWEDMSAISCHICDTKLGWFLSPVSSVL